ncbi:uncharacterized protein [Periplaneta americana]|uniref:uncharacterized protein isoform X2 n=1 Tax=Periplaneta americana TaxID=6978 RepID=UPI0037E921BC
MNRKTMYRKDASHVFKATIVIVICFSVSAAWEADFLSLNSSKLVIYRRTKDVVVSLGRTTSKGWRTFKELLQRKVGAPMQAHLEKLNEKVYAVGQFMNTTKERSMTLLNDTRPLVGEPAVMCEPLSCSACVFISLPTFKFVKDVCLQVAIVLKELALSIRLLVDGKSLGDYTLSWKNRPELNLNFGRFRQIHLKTKMYNNYLQNKTWYTCISLEVGFKQKALLFLDIGCFYAGSEGVGKWEDEGQGDVEDKHIETQRNVTGGSVPTRQGENKEHGPEGKRGGFNKTRIEEAEKNEKKGREERLWRKVEFKEEMNNENNELQTIHGK